MVSQLKVRGAPAQFAPIAFQVQLAQWTESGIAPDNELLHAVLCNDLGKTLAFATTPDGFRLAHDTWIWLLNFAPPQCYGSRTAVYRWEQAGGRAWLL